MWGSSGDDVIAGNAATDALYGFRGDDDLSGSDGDDLLVGGMGQDDLDGGPGTDTCVSGTTVTSCEATARLGPAPPPNPWLVAVTR